MAQSSVMEPRPMVISPPNSVLEVDEVRVSPPVSPTLLTRVACYI